jgi:hypothetical protein
MFTATHIFSLVKSELLWNLFFFTRHSELKSELTTVEFAQRASSVSIANSVLLELCERAWSSQAGGISVSGWYMEGEAPQ